MVLYPDMPTLFQISERLKLIFPEGTYNRDICVRDSTAKTVFAFLYTAAIEGNDRFIAPQHVYKMSDKVASNHGIKARDEYLTKAPRIGKAWFADNSRETIRDENIRNGLMQNGAVKKKGSISVTSSHSRYCLTRDFANLFDPKIEGTKLIEEITNWRDNNLNPGALARVRILQGLTNPTNKVIVIYPSGETRFLNPGLSSEISKSVIEQFAPRFLHQPTVALLSESGNKIISRDDQTLKHIGLDIDVKTNLPDIVLVELGTVTTKIVFVEVVATDGPIDERRAKELYGIAEKAGFEKKDILLVTAFKDRDNSVCRKYLNKLAWDSFAWCVSEPDALMILHPSPEKITK